MRYTSRFFGKHKMIYTLLTLLLAICCTLLGCVLNIGNNAKISANHEEEKAGATACQMFTTETLPDLEFYSYMDNTSKLFQQLQAFQKELREEDCFSYIIQSEQCLEVTKPEIEDIFLEYYEEGEAEYSVIEYEGKSVYVPKTLQVSEKFFEAYSIQADEGKLFSKKDYQYNQNQTVPIILGSAYKDFFKLGDTIEAYYLGPHLKFQVIGFLDASSFYFRWNSDELISCERYIIMPAFKNLPDNKFGKRALLQYCTAYIESEKSYDQIYKKIQTLKENYQMPDEIFSMQNRNQEYSQNNIFQTYSAMTSAVSKYFNTIIGIMIVCIGIILTIVLTNMIQEENYNFGIYIMCGMEQRKLASLIFQFDCAIVGWGDFITLALLILNQISVKNILLVQLVMAFILVASFLGCYLRIRKMQVAQLIGGKE